MLLEFSVRHPFFHKKRGFCLTLLSVSFLAGCASQPTDDMLWSDLDQQVIQESLEGLNDFYVEDIDLKTLSLAGMQAALKSDPELSVSFREDELTLLSADEIIHKTRFSTIDLKYPASWAKAGHDLIREAQKNSYLIRQENQEDQLTAYIDAMIAKLDRFTRYAPPQEAFSIQQNRDGFGGIGITVEKRDTSIHVATIEENSPAENSRLQIGDQLLSVDGVTLDSLGIEEVYTLSRGPIISQSHSQQDYAQYSFL